MLVNQQIFKDIIGGVQTKLNHETVKPFIRKAEFAFRNEIGVAMYETLATYPVATANPALEKETYLLEFAHACICWDAYKAALPHLKMRVGDLGVMKSVPANSTPISKWEYVDALESADTMYDDSLNTFYEILEDLAPAPYTASENFKMRHALFIESPARMNYYVGMMGRNVRFYNKLVPYIRRAEELYIQPILGLYYSDFKIACQNMALTPLTLNEANLLEAVRKALGPLAFFEAYPYLPLKIDENGKREVRKKDGLQEEEVAEKGYRNAQRQQLYNDSVLYTARLKDYIQATASTIVFPQFYDEFLANPAPINTEDYTGKSFAIM